VVQADRKLLQTRVVGSIGKEGKPLSFDDPKFRAARIVSSRNIIRMMFASRIVERNAKELHQQLLVLISHTFRKVTGIRTNATKKTERVPKSPLLRRLLDLPNTSTDKVRTACLLLTIGAVIYMISVSIVNWPWVGHW